MSNKSELETEKVSDVQVHEKFLSFGKFCQEIKTLAMFTKHLFELALF